MTLPDANAIAYSAGFQQPKRYPSHQQVSRQPQGWWKHCPILGHIQHSTVLLSRRG
jgi:hypothetical protein